MYLRNIRPSATCLYSAASMLPRSLSAAAHSVASKASVGLAGAPAAFFDPGLRPLATFPLPGLMKISDCTDSALMRAGRALPGQRVHFMMRVSAATEVTRFSLAEH